MRAKEKNDKILVWILLIIFVITFICVCLYVYTEDSIPTPLETPVSATVVPTVLAQTSDETPTQPLSKIDWYEVYFTSPKIPFDKVYKGGIEDHLIQKIDSSQKTIDLAVFEFDIESVAKALIRAKDRGVRVRIVYDNEYTDSDPQMKELIKSGIWATPDKRSAYMHNKFFIFDGHCVWTGSFNISMNAAYRNNENALYFCSDEASKNYEIEFSEMYDGHFGPSSDSNTPYPEFVIGDIKVANYFAPEDKVMDKILKEVRNADKSIHFMAYSFTDDSLGQLMSSRRIDGVQVEGIFEANGADTKFSECGILLGKRLDVRLDGNPRTFHHKVIIIDGDTVVLGSFNFSANANTQNDENLLIVHDSALASEYEQEYQRMKEQAVIPSGKSCSK